MSSSVNVPNAEPVTENIHTLIHQAFFAPSISDSSLLSCHRRFPTLAGWSWGIILCIDYKRMQMAWIWDKMAMTCRGLLSASGVWGFRTLHYWSLISQTHAWRSVQRLTFQKGKRPACVRQATGKWAAPRGFLTSPTLRGGEDGWEFWTRAQAASCFAKLEFY